MMQIYGNNPHKKYVWKIGVLNADMGNALKHGDIWNTGIWSPEFVIADAVSDPTILYMRMPFPSFI